MVLYENLCLVQSEFCIKRTTKKFLMDNKLKLLTKESELDILPRGCLRDSISGPKIGDLNLKCAL